VSGAPSPVLIISYVSWLTKFAPAFDTIDDDAAVALAR
jgi:hypothetical protein